jgi:hypothetical protein
MTIERSDIMRAVTHLEKVIVGEVSAVTHLEKVIASETSAVTYTEKVITGEAPPITHLQKVIAGEASPVTHLEYVWTGGTPSPTEHEYTGAVPVTITANGEPLIDYTIYGNIVQTGTPTPDAPIMPTFCGVRTENLADTEQGGINLQTGADEAYTYRRSQIRTQYVQCSPSTAYTVSSTLYPVQIFIAFYDNNKQYISRTSGYDISTAIAFNTPAGAAFMRAASYHNLDAQIYPFSDGAKIMLNPGSTSKPYEPYGYKIPISSANATTPVYLGEVQTTRKVKKVVFDGTESWQAGTENFYRIIDSFGEGIPYSSVICTHAQHSTINNNGKALYIKISDFSPISSVTDFKAYLSAQYAAGTPVTVWYVLATEQTGIVNEPLMRIGDYADTLSMEQAGVSIPTLNGQTVIDVDTTLKPSEVYIKYQG